jgi:hypothetical protein
VTHCKGSIEGVDEDLEWCGQATAGRVRDDRRQRQRDTYRGEFALLLDQVGAALGLLDLASHFVEPRRSLEDVVDAAGPAKEALILCLAALKVDEPAVSQFRLRYLLCSSSQKRSVSIGIEVVAMSLLLRWLHVSSVAFVFGGALLIFILLQIAQPNRDASAQRMLFDLLRAFEWGSWASLGFVVATGIGNLGHFGEGLPEPRSEWGREFTVKLGLVAVFLVFSALRTLSVAIAASQAEAVPLSRGAQRNLTGLYGATAVFVAAIAGIAVALAHF